MLVFKSLKIGLNLDCKTQQEVLDWMASIHKVHVIWVLPFTCAFLALYTQRSYYTVLQKKKVVMSYFVLNPFRPHQTRASANVIRATMARTATSCAQILASVPQTGCVSVVLKGEEESTATNLVVLACLTPTAPGVAPVSLVSVSNIW